MKQYEPYPKTATELKALPEAPDEAGGLSPLLQDLVIKVETDAGEVIMPIWHDGRWMKVTRRMDAT